MKRIILVVVFTYIIFGCLIYSALIAQPETGRLKSAKVTVEDSSSKILVCSKVFEALGKIADPQAKDVLIKGLKSKEFLIRAYAVEAMGRLNEKEAIPLLKNLVGDESYFVRILVMKNLIKLGEISMEKPLLNFLKDKNPEVRANTVEALGDFRNKYLSDLVKILLEDNSYIVRIKAIQQLGRNKFNPAVTLIRKALEDENPLVRQAAFNSLADIGDKQAIPLLIERLKDKDVSVRAAAKERLGRLGERLLAKSFWEDVENPNPILRASSIVALANLKDVDILPFILKEIIAPENQGFVRAAAARALVILKPEISKLITQALAKSKVNMLLLENIEGSFKVNGKDLVLLITEALKDEKNPLHQEAPLILRELREEISLPALREALSQEYDPYIVASVAYTLGEFKDKKAVNYLIDICKKYGF